MLIGHDQTISPPFIVALITHFREVKSGHTVLEIGQHSLPATMLARLVRKVCTISRSSRRLPRLLRNC